MKHDWEYKKLGDVATFQRGLTYSSEDEVDISTKCVLRSNNINLENSCLDFSELKYLREDFIIPEDRMFCDNSIFICMSNGSKQHIGKVAYIKDKINYAFGGFMGLIVPNPSVQGKFVYYNLRSSQFKHFLNSVGEGANIKNLRFADLSKYTISLPPLPTQQSIVSELDSLSKIIADCKETLKDYDALEQSIFYDMFGDPVKNEKGWEVKKLGEVGTSELGKMLDSKKNTGKARQYLCTINVLWEGIDLTNVKEMKIEDDDIERYSVKKGDLLICEGGDTGRCAIWENDETICYQNSLHRVRFDQSLMLAIVCKKIFELYKRDGVIENYSKGQTIKHLVKNSLLTIPLPVPPLPLQQQFASKIEAIEQMKSETKKALQETETLFQARMDYWFN